MPRLKISLPEHFIFQTEIQIQISQINYGGHLGNDSVLSLCHEARLQFLKSLGWTELNIEGLGLIMTDSQITYRAEAFHGDLLEVQLFIGEISEHSFELFYLLINKLSKKEIARAKTGMTFFDYQLRKIAKLPSVFREKLL